MRQPTSFRVLGRGSRTVGVFACEAHLHEWQRRFAAAVAAKAAPAEEFQIVGTDSLGVEVFRTSWSPTTGEAPQSNAPLAVNLLVTPVAEADEDATTGEVAF